ncbi:MAG: hypothetical protein KDD45_04150 [Bdellovibrionales bacterium]|nr:hypothetical protein [Bdellovibrionales bacterium]
MKKEGEKEVLNRKRLFLGLGLIIGLGAMVVILFGSSKDTSVIVNSTEPIKMEATGNQALTSQPIEDSKKVNGMLNASAQIVQSQSSKKHSNLNHRYVKKIEYKAVQVIERKGVDGLEAGLPLGTNLVGKLLTSIDTREMDQLYKVLLPYGGRDKNGGSLPANTIIFGKINYPGKGEKVFIQFSQALLPGGKEVELKAQALNSKDYSPGLIGEYHGKRTERIAATLGLSMVSAMTDTLTERETLGSGSSNNGTIAMEATPKATARNAFYQGVSKASEMEAQRQASELGNELEYVTVPAGQEMIVNLVSTYYDK